MKKIILKYGQKIIVQIIQKYTQEGLLKPIVKFGVVLSTVKIMIKYGLDPLLKFGLSYGQKIILLYIQNNIIKTMTKIMGLLIIRIMLRHIKKYMSVHGLELILKFIVKTIVLIITKIILKHIQKFIAKITQQYILKRTMLNTQHRMKNNGNVHMLS